MWSDDAEEWDESKEEEDISEELSHQQLLNCAIQNRIKRKAKNIAMSSAEFILAVISLLLEIGQGIVFGGKVLGITAIVYVTVMAIVTMVHAYRLPSNIHTTLSIENAFKKTNNFPIIDGVLEIPLVIRYGSVWFALLVWGVFVVVFITLVSLLVYTQETRTTIAAGLLAALTLYNVTSDICEYHVLTRKENMDLNKTKDPSSLDKV
jgi:hypothetical protein